MSQPNREAEIAEFVSTLPSCNLCGKDWYEGDEDELNEQLDNLKETKRCLGCFEEWGDQWPDQI